MLGALQWKLMAVNYKKAIRKGRKAAEEKMEEVLFSED